MATNLAAYLLANFCEDAVVTSPPLGNIREVYCRRGSSASNNSKSGHVEDGSSQDEATQAGPNGNVSNVLIGNSVTKTNHLLVNCVRDTRTRDLSLETGFRDERTSDLPSGTCVRDKRRRNLSSESRLRENIRGELSLESCHLKDSSDPRGRSTRTESYRREEINIDSRSSRNCAIVCYEGNVFLIDAGNYVEDYFSVSDVSEMQQIPVSDRLSEGQVTKGQVDVLKHEKCSVASKYSSNDECYRIDPETSLGNNENLPALSECPHDFGVYNSVGSDPLQSCVGLMTSSTVTGLRDVMETQRVVTEKEDERRHKGKDIKNSKHLLSCGSAKPLSTEHLNQCPSPKTERGSEYLNRNGEVIVGNDSDSISRNCMFGHQDMVSGNHSDGSELPAQSNVSNWKEIKMDISSIETIPPKDSENLMNCKEGHIVGAPYKGMTFQERRTTFHAGLNKETDEFTATVKDSSESETSILDEQSSSNLSEDSSNRNKQLLVKCDSAKVSPLADRIIDQIDRCDSSNSNSSDDQRKLKRTGVIQSQSPSLQPEQRDGEQRDGEERDGGLNVLNIGPTRTDEATPEDSRRSHTKESSSEDQIDDEESTFPSLVSSDSGVYTPVCESFRDESSFPTSFGFTEARMLSSDPEEYDSIQSELLFSLTESVDGSIASFNDFNNPMSGRIFRSGESVFRGGESGVMSPGSDYWTRMCSGNVNLLSFGSDESIDRSEHDGDIVINENPVSRQYASIQSNDGRHLPIDSGKNCGGPGSLQKQNGLPNATVRNYQIRVIDSVLQKSPNPRIGSGSRWSDPQVVNSEISISGEKIENIPRSVASGVAENLSVEECPQLTEDLKNAIRRAMELEQRQLEKEERRKIKRYEIYGERDDEDVYEALEEEISSNDEEEDTSNGTSLVRRRGASLPGHGNPDTNSNKQIGPVKENHISNNVKFRCVGSSEEIKQGFNNRAKIQTQPDASGNGVRSKGKRSNEEGIEHPIHTSINARESRSTNIPIRGPEPDQTVPNRAVPIPGNMASLIQALKERGQKRRLPVPGAEDKPSLLDDYLLIRNKISTLLSDVKDMSRTAQENRTGFSVLQQRTNDISVERDGLMRLRDAVLHGS